MYGYVRPLRGELKVSQYEAFQSVYCGLCRTLRRRYGPFCRFLVNYDFTFLAMLLARPGCDAGCVYRHCPTSFLRRRRCLDVGPELEEAADCSVILGWWKLRDGARDERFLRAAGCRIGCFLLKGRFRRARGLRPAFAAEAETQMSALAALEADRCPSLDRAADPFALLLKGTAREETDDARRRVLEALLYHLGRVVYVLDAVDDLEDDRKKNAYNPLLYRFSPENGALRETDCETLRETVRLSMADMNAAFALLERTRWTPILDNILTLGLPWTAEAVFSGTWKDLKKKKRRKQET